MRSISSVIILAGLTALAAGCTVNTAPPARTTVVTQPAPAVVTPAPAAVVTTPNTTYVTPPRTTVVTPAY